ncbi:MAG: ABC transporter permease [Candidatus Limnocylindria bacterium]
MTIRRGVVLSAPAVLFLLVAFVYPFGYGVVLSLTPRSGGPLANFSAFLGDEFQRASIGNTFALAVPAALICVGLAVPLAYRMRRGIRGERTLTALLVVPVTLGPVFIADAMLFYFGPVGWFNRVLQATGVSSEPVRLIHTYAAVLLAIVLTAFPFAFLLLLGYVSGIDPVLERAAHVLGAGPWMTFRRVLLPLMAPGIATCFALTFVIAFGVFPSAVLLGEPGGSTRVLAIAAYQAAYEKFDFSAGSAIALLMGLLQLGTIGLVFGARARLYSGARGGKG